jgi:manganese/iron transport system ATP-binding protein
MKGAPWHYCLEVRNLAAGYGERPAIEDVSFAVRPGQMVGVIGPNGAGKTTLFKAILGLLPRLSGEILLHDADALGQRAMMGYLPQLDAIQRSFPVSVSDVVMMGRYPQIGRLSGGQTQRALLARVLAQDPHLLLLDEPVSGVDPTTQHAIFSVLEELRDNGKTVIVATHDLNCVVERFDLVLCLNRRLVAWGPPAEVFRDDLLEQTYGSHLMIIRVGDRRIVVADEHVHRRNNDQ